jgi:hypothetical protein
MGKMARIRPQMIEPFPGPGGPGDEEVGAVQPDQPQRPVLAAADSQGLEVDVGGDGQGGDDGGQGVTADELQHQPSRAAGADPAQQRAEPVGQRRQRDRPDSRSLKCCRWLQVWQQ